MGAPFLQWFQWFCAVLLSGNKSGKILTEPLLSHYRAFERFSDASVE